MQAKASLLQLCSSALWQESSLTSCKPMAWACSVRLFSQKQASGRAGPPATVLDHGTIKMCGFFFFVLLVKIWISLLCTHTYIYKLEAYCTDLCTFGVPQYGLWGSGRNQQSSSPTSPFGLLPGMKWQAARGSPSPGWVLCCSHLDLTASAATATP